MITENDGCLVHYGVPGQKWGRRQWQNADGTYTEAGKHHYGWGYGRRSGDQNTAVNPGRRRLHGTVKRTAVNSKEKSFETRSPRDQQPTQEEIEARRIRTRKILGIAAGVAVTAVLSYAAYRGSTNLRNSMRRDVYKNFDTDPRNLHTFASKYWESSDRKKYSELTAKRAKDVADNITRRDAVAARFTQRTGIRINMPQSRKRVLAQRQSENRYANFIRDAEKRGAMNKSIHDARAELRARRKN